MIPSEAQARAAALNVDRPQISLIIPTLEEAQNLPSLIPQIAAALAGRAYEIIIVDDGSRDGTSALCQALAQRHPLRLLTRPHPSGGLSGAVIEGFAIARGEFLVVMDADLQHSPDELPSLLAPLDRDEADFVIGSRHVPGASIDGGWPLLRRLNSWIASTLARPIAASTHDPTSGFFALRRGILAQAGDLSPQGYKIALELLCKTRVRRIREVPIHFGRRTAGESKLSLREQLRYLDQLSRLYDFAWPRFSPVMKFLLVEMLGLWVGSGVMLLALFAGSLEAGAAAVGYLGAIAVSWVFHVRSVRVLGGVSSVHRPWMTFTLLALFEWAVSIAAGVWASARLHHPSPMEILAFSFTSGFLARHFARRILVRNLRGISIRSREQSTLPHSQPARRAA